MSVRFHLEPTTDPRVFDYEATVGTPTDFDGGLRPAGSERGKMQVTADGLSVLAR